MGASRSAVCWVVAMCILFITLSPRYACSQIPAACADPESLESMVCCPNDCNRRGTCMEVENRRDNRMINNVRYNWPHYFQRVCYCTGNYAGYDCSRCKYGHYGPNCSKKETLRREDILTLTDVEFQEYARTLMMTRSYDSGYVAVLEEREPGNSSIEMANLTLYEMFVWLHHYAAKNNECKGECEKVDYAHESSGFPTWHRQYLLWLEWEIQYMLKNFSNPKYNKFRVPYWDWRYENRTEVFRLNRLGDRPADSSQSLVQGTYFDDGWDTICWFNGSGGLTRPKGTICNPRNSTGPLQRCPIVDQINPCKGPSYWPSPEDVDNAIARPMYDTRSFDRNANEKSFRNLMEGFETGVSQEHCDNNKLCKNLTQRHLHNTVHIIVGIGDLRDGLDLSASERGVMGDVAASPNDPIFINHHAMIDCILEEWLQKNKNDRFYPDVPEEIRGHQREGYIVPFFPLYKHSDIFKTADNFGYSCDIVPGLAIRISMAFSLLIFVTMCTLTLQLY